MQLSTIVEALLIASEDPLTAGRVLELLQARGDQLVELGDQTSEAESALLESLEGIDESTVLTAIDDLNQRYAADGRSFQLLEQAKGWKLFTRPEFAGIIGNLYPVRKIERFSGPAMETLAIVAYRQPITKAAIEAVRGVNCDAMLQKMLDRELIRIAGRAELPGRPLLYETTDLFFEHFGIRTIDDLPNAHELRKARLPAADEEDAATEKAAEPEKQLVLSAVDKQQGNEDPAPQDNSPADTPEPDEVATAEASHASPEPQQT